MKGGTSPSSTFMMGDIRVAEMEWSEIPVYQIYHVCLYFGCYSPGEYYFEWVGLKMFTRRAFSTKSIHFDYCLYQHNNYERLPKFSSVLVGMQIV